MVEINLDEPFEFGEYPTSGKLNMVMRRFARSDVVQPLSADVTAMKGQVANLAAQIATAVGSGIIDPALVARVAAAEAEIDSIQAVLAVGDPSASLAAQITSLRTDLTTEASQRLARDTFLSNDYQQRLATEAQQRGAADDYLTTQLSLKQPALGFTPVTQAGAHNVALSWSDQGFLQGAIDNSFYLGELWTANRAPAALGSSGWQRLPSGLMLQYGFTNSQNGFAAPCIFPTAFNYCLGVFVMSVDASNWINPNTGECYPRSIGVHTFDAFGFTFTMIQSQPNGATLLAPNENVRFLAIGT